MTPKNTAIALAAEYPALGIRTVNYSFSSAGMTEARAQAHAKRAAGLLARLFKLAPEAIAIKYKERLPEAVPFSLTCYKGKCSSEVAVILAAKILLPLLAQSRRVGMRGQNPGNEGQMASTA